MRISQNHLLATAQKWRGGLLFLGLIFSSSLLAAETNGGLEEKKLTFQNPGLEANVQSVKAKKDFEARSDLEYATALLAQAEAEALTSDSENFDSAGSEDDSETTGEAVKLPAMTVTGQTVGGGYNVYSASTATRTDTLLMETPASVQIVPRQVIDDRQYTGLQGALGNVAGVMPVPSLGLGTRYLIRGFRTDQIYRNGLQSSAINAGFPTEYDTATIERIEVLKGPASVLYGRIEPGGLINIVTKKPLVSPYHDIELQVGSFNYRRVVADSTGPLDKEGNWLYRLVGAWQKNDTFRDFDQDDRWLIAPSFTWRPGPATDLRVSLEYFELDHQADRGIPVIGTRPARLPRSRSFRGPDDPFDHLTRLQVGTEFNHHFNTDWTLRHQFLFGQLENKSAFVKAAIDQSGGLEADGRTLDRNIFRQRSESEYYSTKLEILGHIELGPTGHQLLAGVDYIYGRTHYATFGDFIHPVPGLSIDIFNPIFDGIDPSVFETALVPFPTNRNHSVFKDHVFGIYLQDHITIGEKLHLLLGGRYDWAQAGRGRGASEEAAENDVPALENEAFSPRVAVLYQFLPSLSGYASWSQSFGANNGTSATGEPLEPKQGEQYEIGLKAQLFDQRLLATVLVYHLTKTNVPTAAPATPDPFDVIPTGEQRARGVEIELSGQVTKQLNLVVSYAYTDAEVTKDNRGREGNRLAQVPKNALSFWGRYDFSRQSALSGLTLGFGGVFVGDRPGDLDNTFKLPGYVRLDAMVAYHFRLGDSRLTAQINVRNLLDEYYFASASPFGSRQHVLTGAPRTVIGAIEIEF